MLVVIFRKPCKHECIPRHLHGTIISRSSPSARLSSKASVIQFDADMC
jgi:hypothetical protein